MNLNQYHNEIDQVVKHIEDVINEQDLDIDSEENGNVFRLLIDDVEIIITRQEAKFELWFAAKVPGAFHFTFQDGQWISLTENKNFYSYLNKAVQHLGIEPLF